MPGKYYLLDTALTLVNWTDGNTVFNWGYFFSVSVHAIIYLLQHEIQML